MEQLKSEIKALIIEALRLQPMKPEEIQDEAPLFGEGLGLDSLDALEIAVALEHRYGFKLELSADEGRSIFASVDTLAAHVARKRSR